MHQENLQDTLKEVIHSAPVELLSGPQKVVHPFPEISPPTLLPPKDSCQLLCEVELNCQDVHRSPLQGSPDVDHNDNSAKSCTKEAVTRRNLKSLQLSIKPDPPKLKYSKDIQVCSALLTLFILQKTYAYEDPVRRPCLFLSDHQMTHPRQWTCQE